MKKYELMKDDTKRYNGVTLYKIKALKKFADVEIGDLGGYVQSDSNLSQDGSAWIYRDAWVYGDARVYGNAMVCGDAMVYGDAWVYGDACVYRYAWVYGGKWDKSPLQIQGSKHFVNMCDKNKLKIGCQEHTLKKWKDNFDIIAKKCGETDKDGIAEYKAYVELAIKIYGLEA